MKTKKVINLILIMVISFFSCKIIVNANSVGAADTDAVGTCSTKDWCWEYDASMVPRGLVNAIRVSIFNSLGEKQGNSLDFMNDDNRDVYQYLDKNNTKVFYSGTKKSKVEYVEEYVEDRNEPTLNSDAPIEDLVIYLDFISLMTLHGTTNPNVIKDQLGIHSFEDFSGIFSSYEKNFDIKFDDIRKNPEEYYVTIEPATIILNRPNEKLYYGTYTELLRLYKYTGLPGSPGLFEAARGGFMSQSIFLATGNIGNPLHEFAETLEQFANNDNETEYSNKFGIGVLWFGENVEVENQIGNCDGTAFSLEYRDQVVDNVLMEGTICCRDGDEDCHNKAEKYTACQIVCDEKYYIETFRLRDIFNPVINKTTSGILAGTYFPINAPTVYHKKTCKFIREDDATIRGWAVNLSEECVEHEICTNCPTTLTETYKHIKVCEVTGNPDSIAEAAMESCDNLKLEFDKMLASSSISLEDNADTDLTIKISSNAHSYKLKAKKVGEPIIEQNEDKTYFFYKDTYSYSIHSNSAGVDGVNKYIGLSNSAHYFADSSKATNDNYDNGIAMATTPINVLAGKYQYEIDFLPIFATNPNFLTLVHTDPNALKFEKTTNTACEFNIVSRDNNIVGQYCDPNSATGVSCGDPDSEFDIVKLKMVYRPINLKNPFPGIDYKGQSRTPGRNWTEILIKTYITKNRDANTDEVYQKTPLYIIDLDAEKINSIREYNKQTNYDDFTLKCTAGTGRECISPFLRGQLTGELVEPEQPQFSTNLLSGGDCVDETKIPLPNDNGIPNLNFDICRGDWG